ncbi:hypothetical protein [Endozoicomonas sp. SCSIO W0465]|uniref:hypothetical protein n=1 Tax=Endozoicomonas sp. SCSIO W0465 TaxID=2918516 RepID=UPI0020756F18|nr:hypothetical protein [Endozoicomonas sp. SCSIO W0465]USE37718.1 hypothetical protein MJO57_05830 [Endozoicomonas sp. SCSIO W0465]
MLANIVEKWCLRGWYKNQKIPDLCGGAEQLQSMSVMFIIRRLNQAYKIRKLLIWREWKSIW